MAEAEGMAVSCAGSTKVAPDLCAPIHTPSAKARIRELEGPGLGATP